MENQYYICKRMRMMSYLVEKGFVYEKTIPDMTNPKFKCWLFRSSTELQKAIDDYFAQIRTKNN